MTPRAAAGGPLWTLDGVVAELWRPPRLVMSTRTTLALVGPVILRSETGNTSAESTNGH